MNNSRVVSGLYSLSEGMRIPRRGCSRLRLSSEFFRQASTFEELHREVVDIPFTAEVLYFSKEPEPTLIAYDVIEQAPESGSLQVRRVNVPEEFGDLVLTPTPTPTVTPFVSSSPSVSPSPSP